MWIKDWSLEIHVGPTLTCGRRSNWLKKNIHSLKHYFSLFYLKIFSLRQDKFIFKFFEMYLQMLVFINFTLIVPVFDSFVQKSINSFTCFWCLQYKLNVNLSKIFNQATHTTCVEIYCNSFVLMGINSEPIPETRQPCRNMFSSMTAAF